ncbi:hypothetical protein ACFQ05_30410 [Amycolatopsis umgeniensis]|uniref:DUF4145 domain-containing protein n=1 Tax=Amycolatopsis umgeniensis TaxID=336628 RepID=A0A841BD26_9PSEU|nr:hypothetical protein [Amycolatopsis umgeniensis]MBB5857217.1 hypothetical protein [Amycolatopsis umgeniensis]
MDIIDEQTLVAVADLICGDGTVYYRRAADLVTFFRRAGWNEVGEYDGDSRKSWTVAHLLCRRTEPDAIEQVLKRLVDPREYQQDRESAEEVFRQLNLLLQVENLHVELDANLRPAIRPGRMATDPAPLDISRQKLQYSVDEVVTDQKLVPILDQRIAEIDKCRATGCYLAAMILLGSLVELLLLDAAENRPIPDEIWNESEAKAERVRPAKTADKLSLHSLIYVAHRLKWIDTDAYRIASVLREFRNLVHPNLERKLTGRPPDEDTVDMYWPVFIGTFNDLGRSRPGGPGAEGGGPSTDPAGPWGRRRR